MPVLTLLYDTLIQLRYDEVGTRNETLGGVVRICERGGAGGLIIWKEIKALALGRESPISANTPASQL